MPISNPTFTFLTQLAQNNNKTWFASHKTEFEQARENVVDVTRELIARIAEFDPSVKHVDAHDCLFRIYRDVRFSREKTPYKTNFGSAIVAGGRKSGRAGYYFHIKPAESFVGGGMHEMTPQQLGKMRDVIARDHKKLRTILTAPAFVKFYPELWDDRLKTAPRGFSEDHPAIDLLRYKSFSTICEFSDADMMARDFEKRAADAFFAIKPLDDFLNKIVE